MPIVPTARPVNRAPIQPLGVVSLLVLGIALFTSPTSAISQPANTVYRCVSADGKIVLQQSPCAGPAAAGDAHRVEGALRNARDDRDLVATINACRGVDKSSPEYSRCSAVLLCVEGGLVGANLRSCITRARIGYANEQRVWLELKRQEAEEMDRLAEETRAMASPESPPNQLVVGRVFVSDDLAKLIDSKYPGTEWYADQSLGIPYRGAYFLVQTEKLGGTDVPVRYRIASISRVKSMPEKTAMSISGRASTSRGVTAPTSSSGLPVVSCDDLRDYAELAGHGFVARGAIVTSARAKGLCR